MQEVAADLEPQEDASVSSDDRFADDKSVDTSVEVKAEPVEVETEIEDPEAEPENEADPSPAEVEVLDEKADTHEEAPLSKGAQERIDEVIKSLRETERQSAAKDIEIAELREKLAAIPVKTEPFKTLADFDFDEGRFQQYMAQEIDARAAAAGQRAALEVRGQAEVRLAEERFDARAKEFSKSVKDYAEVALTKDLKINAPMASVIMAQENGPELAYYLGKHPDVASKLSTLSPQASGFELGLIQAKLATEKAKAAAPKVTKAPPPPPKIKSGDAGLSRDPADMSDKQFAAWRRKQIAAR
jgi:hypothetical protein